MLHRAPPRLDARRADECGDRARVLGTHLVDGRVERERVAAEPERSARDRWDERNLVAIPELVLAAGIFLVDGVEQPFRLAAEVERRPHVAEAHDAFHLALAPAGALAQACE